MKPLSDKLKRWRRYSVLFVFSMLMIWVPVAMYVKFVPPTFISSWSILIPGSNIGANVNLESLGQATTSVNSPYASSSVDPKVNYKAIAMSLPVLRIASKNADMSVDEFGKPKIKLVDQTAIMQVTFSGGSIDNVYNRSVALYEALEDYLDQLRRSERLRIQEGNSAQLADYQTKVEDAQKALLDFQAESHVVSIEQFNSLVQNVDALRMQRSDAQVRFASLCGQIESLSQILGLDSKHAAMVLLLQQDQFLQGQLKAVSQANDEYTTESALLGRKHPKVKQALAKQNRARQEANRRAAFLVGDNSGNLAADFIQRYLPIASNQSSSELYQQIVSLESERSAVEGEMSKLNELIPGLEKQVQQSSLHSARLQDLERSHQVANTIFLSALAKLDLGKSDIYASYPMTQVLLEPTKPKGPQKLQRVFAIIGALIGSMFITFSLVILWKRRVLLQKLSKRKLSGTP